MKTCPQCSLQYPDGSAFCFVDGATLVSSKDPRIGSTVAGRYVIDRVLGEGGMATVYAARHKLVDRPCALKILSSTFSSDPTTRERFRREARHAQRLAHPNIIEIFDQGDTDDGSPFLVMELLEGVALADAIGHGPLPLERGLPVFLQMTRALARAHDFEVIHRDLKPENVFLMPGDRVKLLDFGIARCAQDARLTGLGEIFGTPQYMAPERGHSIDSGPAADLYSLGIIVFEVVTGRLPFEARDAASILIKHMKEPAPRLRRYAPDAPEALDRLVHELLMKDPADRPVDAHRVLRDLRAISESLGIDVPPAPEIGSDAVTPTVPREALDLWERRTALFEQMLSRGFGAGVPNDLARLLSGLKTHVHEIGELRTRALLEQRKLEQIELQGRESRLSIGRAMDELTVEASVTREEARALRAQVATKGEESKRLIPQVMDAHREALRWEGRSGFQEPYPQLADAYRQLAAAVDRWYAARREELRAESDAAEKESLVADVDYQIKELRRSKAARDREIEERRQACLATIADMGRRADQLESELFHLAIKFCAPLRQKPELGELFIELERDAAGAMA